MTIILDEKIYFRQIMMSLYNLATSGGVRALGPKDWPNKTNAQSICWLKICFQHTQIFSACSIFYICSKSFWYTQKLDFTISIGSFENSLNYKKDSQNKFWVTRWTRHKVISKSLKFRRHWLHTKAFTHQIYFFISSSLNSMTSTINPSENKLSFRSLIWLLRL